MANYRGHLMGGICAFAVPMLLQAPQKCMQPYTPANMLVWLACSIAGGLFPDIDIHSEGRKLWNKGVCLFAVAIMYTEQWFLTTPLVALALFPYCLTHRGLTHRIWFIIGAPLALAYSSARYIPRHEAQAWLCALFFIAGALSHWILDYGPRMIMTPKRKRK